MKNLFKTMMLVAVAAMGFTACSNEAFEEVNPANEKTFSLTAMAEKPALESDTRTEFSEGTVIWNSGDQIRACYYEHTTHVWSKYYASTENNVAEDGTTATFTGFSDFPAIDGGTYTFYAGYPKNVIGNNNTTAPTDGELAVEVATEQTMPKMGTFDANADILLGKAVEEISDISAGSAIELSFNYTRQVAHACVTLKNLAAVEGEIVKTVTFTAPEGVSLTGAGTVNFTNQIMSTLDNNTVTVALPANTAANEAELPVWFCSAPATIISGEALTVAVETTRGTYTRTITAREEGILFLKNRYNTLGINMASAEFEAAAVSENVYQRITSESELTTGEYVIAALYDNTYYPLSAAFTSKKISATSTISVNNDQITETDAEGYVINLNITSDGISIYDGTYYLDWNSSTDFKTKNTTVAYWTATAENGVFKIIDNDTTTSTIRAILWQYNNGTSRFAPYSTNNFSATGYSGLYLFKKTVNDPTAPTLTLDKSELTFEQAGGSQTITATTTNYTGSITASSDNDHFSTSVEGNVVTVTVPANENATAQTATITITAGTLTKTVAVSQTPLLAGTGEGTLESPYDVTRAYAVIDAADGGTVSGVYVKGIVTETAMTFNSSYNSLNYYISVDGTTNNELMAYSGKNLNNTNFTTDYANELHAGDEVVVYGDLKLFNGTYEFNYNNYIVSLTCNVGGGDSGEEPDPTPGEGEGDAVYTKVTSAPADWSGTYLIVYEDENMAFNGALSEKLDATENYTKITISNSTIAVTTETEAIEFTIATSSTADAYTIQSKSGLYMGQTSNANGLQSNSTTTYDNTFSLNTDGSVNIVSGGAYLRFNTTTDQDRFRYFKSSTYTSQKAITLYKKN